MSRWPSGWATITPIVSVVRSARARPERASRCRFSSRIIEAIWARKIAPKAPLSGPSPEAQRRLVDTAIDYQSGDRLRGGRGFVEHFRLGPDNKVHDTQYQVVSGQSSDDERSAKRNEGNARRGEASQRTNARRNSRQQAEGSGSRNSQVRNYYNYWQRGQDTGYLSGDHYP